MNLEQAKAIDVIVNSVNEQCREIFGVLQKEQKEKLATILIQLARTKQTSRTSSNRRSRYKLPPPKPMFAKLNYIISHNNCYQKRELPQIMEPGKTHPCDFFNIGVYQLLSNIEGIAKNELPNSEMLILDTKGNKLLCEQHSKNNYSLLVIIP